MRKLPPCTLVHVSEYDFGWDRVPIYWRDKLIHNHIIPAGDIDIHTCDPNCKCKPYQCFDQEYDPLLWFHTAFDGREHYQTDLGDDSIKPRKHN